jgi:hypothetical protein
MQGSENVKKNPLFVAVNVLFLKFQSFGLFNPLNAELNPICHLLALLGAHHIFHLSGIRFKQR